MFKDHFIMGGSLSTVWNALGFTMDVYSPVPFRGNDMSLFRDSKIKERMENLGESSLFGDSAYRHHSRTHSYGISTGRWKEGAFPLNGTMEREFKSSWDGVARIYIVATLFKNFHAFLYGNQTMNFFNVVRQEDFLECCISGRNIV